MLANREMPTSQRELGFPPLKESRPSLEGTPHLPEGQLLPINPDAIAEMIGKLAELRSKLTPQEETAVEKLYDQILNNFSTAKTKVQDVLDQVRSFPGLKKEKRAYAVASLLAVFSLMLASCATGAEARPLSSPISGTSTSATATATESGPEQQVTPTSEFPQDTQQLESAIANAEGSTPQQAEQFIDQHEGTGGGAGGLDPVFAEIHRNFEASGFTSQILNAEFADLEGAEHDFVLFEIPDYQIEDTSQWVAFPSPVTGEGALFITLAGSNEEVANLDEIVVKWGKAANWLVGLNEDGRAVRTVTPRHGQYEEAPLYGQYTSTVPGTLALVDQMRAEQNENQPPEGTSLEYSANFVPVWHERSIGHSDGLEIPITIGLMEDVVNNSQYPIKEIHMTQEGTDAVAFLFLHAAWGRYRDLMDHPDVTYEQYIELLKTGEGKLDLIILDEDGIARRNAEIDPTQGFSIVWTAKENMPVDFIKTQYPIGFFMGTDEMGRYLFATNSYITTILNAPAEAKTDEFFAFASIIYGFIQNAATVLADMPNDCMDTGVIDEACIKRVKVPQDYENWIKPIREQWSAVESGQSEAPFYWVR